MKCDFQSIEERNVCLKILNSQGYGCRPVWDLLPYVSPYRESIGMSLDCAKYSESSIINLPSGINVCD